MSEQTKIEWCDSTFSPWTGCTKVSPACDHCYAESWSKRAGAKVGKWGQGAPRVRTTAAYWRQPMKWNARADLFRQCGKCRWRGEIVVRAEPTPFECPSCSASDWQRARRRVFCASLADWLDNEVPIEWLVDLLDLIRLTPNLDWLLLTKRIGNWRSRILAAISAKGGISQELATWLGDWIDGNPPANVWLGAMICNQAEADRDIPKILAIPARVRFLSIEPMLGPIYLYDASPIECDHERAIQCPETGVLQCSACENRTAFEHFEDRLHWVIVGGESGHGARPVHPDWVRIVRDDCAAAGVPFLFKQWGEWGTQCADTGSNKPVFRQFPDFQTWVNKARSWVNGAYALIPTAGSF